MNMVETTQILEAMKESLAAHEEFALATIVSVRGSTYRRPGARLVVSSDGSLVGNLSGGCLEGDISQLASNVISGKRAQLELYDFADDSEVVWGWGLGCNGVMEVFVEPGEQTQEIIQALHGATSENRPVALATVIESSTSSIELGTHSITDGKEAVPFSDASLEEAVGPLLEEHLRSGGAHDHMIDLPGGHVRVFVEGILPPPRLLICGAGHDAIPLSRAAIEVGWKVVVVDDRNAFLDADRFPGAEFVSSDGNAISSRLTFDERTFVVLMTHNYVRDRDYLRGVLETPIPYIGMLGPRERTERLLAELRAEGIEVTEEEGAKIHGPAGLDLGAEGPEEIATSIIGEVLAVSRRRSGGFLRHREGAIHDQAVGRPAPAPP